MRASSLARANSPTCLLLRDRLASVIHFKSRSSDHITWESSCSERAALHLHGGFGQYPSCQARRRRSFWRAPRSWRSWSASSEAAPAEHPMTGRPQAAGAALATREQPRSPCWTGQPATRPACRQTCQPLRARAVRLCVFYGEKSPSTECEIRVVWVQGRRSRGAGRAVALLDAERCRSAHCTGEAQVCRLCPLQDQQTDRFDISWALSSSFLRAGALVCDTCHIGPVILDCACAVQG